MSPGCWPGPMSWSGCPMGRQPSIMRRRHPPAGVWAGRDDSDEAGRLSTDPNEYSRSSGGP
jgi:hypothetical protein